MTARIVLNGKGKRTVENYRVVKMTEKFRAFTVNEDEMTRLKGALGNLLPLALSVNIRLQNDPFGRKKTGRSPVGGRDGVGGYAYGCAAEVEVARNDDWNAECIYRRSHALIDFLRQRWEIAISPEDERRILDLEFVRDGREIPPELPAVAEENDVAVAMATEAFARGDGANHVTRGMLERTLGADADGIRNAVSQAVREMDAELGGRLICKANGKTFNRRGRPKGFLHRFKKAICAIDSTTIRLVLNCMDWTKRRRRKAAAKAHALLNITGYGTEATGQDQETGQRKPRG